MTAIDAIREKLTAALAPAELQIEDESARHAGHAGAKPGGETHFRVKIVSSAFGGLSRVTRHRQIYALLDKELSAGVHALALTALTPEEAQRG